MNHQLLAGVASCLVFAGAVAAQTGFVNFENPPVNPLAITPDGTRLLACNTADARIEVFSLTGAAPVRIASIAVGLDPVSVRCRSNTEAWVVNTLSDSLSIVNLTTMNVINTISTGDEPMDVVFAGSPQRAFVSVSQLNQVRVYDPTTLAQVPGSPIAIQGEDPRALATDGTRVFVAIFESGNRTVILPTSVVSNPAGPYGGQNPPPNSNTSFSPPLNPANPAAPAVGLIVHKEGANWKDDNGRTWNSMLSYSTHDNDVASINANTLAVAYVKGLDLNIIANLTVNPANGRVTAVGMNDLNHIRFEPNLKSKFVRVFQGTFEGASGALSGSGQGDINPHLLPYTTLNIPQAQRDQSIGDPRGMVWNAAGTQMYVSGMGSNNVIVTDSSNARIATIGVGQGPTGLALDTPRNRVYCLNRFDGTLSIINTLSHVEVLPRVPYFDPTPSVIRVGRPMLYDTHRFSGLGQVACASCHIDGKMDNEAWDLGDPAGAMKAFNQTCNGSVPGGGTCNDWHPMKGPMTTQTLVGIIGNGPMHWRGDREDLSAFNGAFVGLLGDDAPPSFAELNQMAQFIATIKFPPQPNRTITDAVPTSIAGFTGNPNNGQTLFNNAPIDGGLLTCVSCHTLPTGANNSIISANLILNTQGMKVPQLRNMYEKTGFSTTSSSNNRGVGFTNDGTFDNLFRFLQLPVFTYTGPQPADSQRRDIEAFMMCFPSGTHAAVGMQSTVIDGATVRGTQTALINQMISLAQSNAAGLVVKGRQNGIDRGYVYSGGQFQSDRATQILSASALLASATIGSELTYTMVPVGSQRRIGIDRDSDGFLDRDEIDLCSDPANAAITPANLCRADVAPPGPPHGNGSVNVDDLLVIINGWGTGGPGDIAPGCGNGMINVDDLLAVINAWGPCP